MHRPPADVAPADDASARRHGAPAAVGPARWGRGGGPARPASAVVLTIAVAAVAFNLRPALTSVSPVLSEIQRSTGLSGAEAGLLTTIPVLAFGAFSPLAPWLGRRFGMEGALVGSLVLLVSGILVRSVPALGPLFLGTLLVGVAIAIGNVLVPALIKRDFRDPRAATGVYSVALSAGAAVAAGIAVPLDRAVGGWRPGLDLWAAPVLVCVVLWTLRLRDAHVDIGSAHVRSGLWRDGLAWQVTAFMGLQSLEFYTMVAWVPTIFQQLGTGATEAGWLLSLAGAASLPSAFFVPMLASTRVLQRVAVVAMAALNVLALSGLLWHPRAVAVLWMILLGLSQGAAISLALTFIVARAPDQHLAAELSGMSQTVGYLVGGVGPVVVGALRDATGSWVLPLAILVAVLVPELACGLGSTQGRTVGSAGAGPRAGPSA